MRRYARELVVIVLVACSAAALYALAFYPGAMGFDSAYQWWQARGGQTSNVHSPALTWAWRASDALSDGPGALFLLQLALFFGGVALIALQLPLLRSVWRVAFVLGAGALPICWALFSALLSDTLLVGVLCCAVGLALPLRSGQGPGRFVAVLLLLLIAVLLRKNALPAVLPLLVYAFMRQFGWPLVRSVLAACLVATLMQAAAWVGESRVDRHGSVLPSLELWDLAAMSIDSGQIVLPASSHGPALTVEDLAQAFRPYACSTLFEQTRAGMMPAFVDDGDPRGAQVTQAWLAAIAAHPGAYLRHRWRLTAALFGAKATDWPQELVYFTGETAYRDNPPLPAADGALNRAWLAVMRQLAPTPAFAAWPYLIVSIGVLAVAWRRRREPFGGLALAVVASGWLYGLPLVVLAASAELRYLGWTCVAAYIACALACAAKMNVAPTRVAGDAKSD